VIKEVRADSADSDLAAKRIWKNGEVPMAERPLRGSDGKPEEEPTVSAPEKLAGKAHRLKRNRRKPNLFVVEKHTSRARKSKRYGLSDGSFHFLDHEKRNIALFDRRPNFPPPCEMLIRFGAKSASTKSFLRDRVFSFRVAFRPFVTIRARSSSPGLPAQNRERTIDRRFFNGTAGGRFPPSPCTASFSVGYRRMN